MVKMEYKFKTFSLGPCCAMAGGTDVGILGIPRFRQT